MPRQSITFTPPNEEWLKSQVDSQEYSNKSEVVNDLIRKARSQEAGIEALRAALIAGEKSGLSSKSPDDIIKAVLERKNAHG